MCHDSAAVGSLAAESLLALDLPRYAFVPCKPRRDWSEIRGKAFIAAVSKANKCALEFHGSDLKAWLLSLTKPCGIFAANDQMAQNVVATAQAAGLRIPEDLSVLGVDNDEIYCEGTIPGISSIATDMDAAGYSLGRLLANTIKKPRPTSSIQLYGPSKIILRGSTRLLSHQVPKVAEAIDFAKAHGTHFTTTLTVSPHKDSRLIFSIGGRSPLFEPMDFKKKGGFLRSIQLSKEYGFYRQNFCGCEFSLAASR